MRPFDLDYVLEQLIYEDKTYKIPLIDIVTILVATEEILKEEENHNDV